MNSIEQHESYAALQDRLAALEAKLAEVTAKLDEAIISRDANAQTIDRITKEHSREVEILCSCGDEAQRERDFLRTALRQVAEAAQAVHDELLDRPENILDLSDEVYLPFKDALDLPAVQEVLGRKLEGKGCE